MKKRRPSCLTWVLPACLAAAVVQGWAWVEWSARAGRALAALAQVRQERDWLARQDPAPSEAAARAIAAERDAWRSRVADLRNSLRPRAPAPLAEEPPTRPTDAFFSLADWVEQLRAQAASERISLRADERFGFSAYAHEGPAAELLAGVHRQQLAVRALLEALFEARPLALLGIQRAPPAGAPPRIAGEDYFTLPPALSLQQPGLVGTEALRVEFTGQTSTLRGFLAGLGALRHPVIVRSVDVEPLPPDGGSRPVNTAEAPVPVVRQSLSKFAVTVEFVLLAAVPATSTP